MLTKRAFNSARICYREASIIISSRKMAASTGSAESSPKFIGTHDGTFHCDDVTACFMLKQLDRFKNHDIVRTRDPEKLARAEIVVDVGSELNIDALRLDHHQRSFNQTIHNYYPKLKTTNPEKPPRLSSSGLVYAIFGKNLIMKLLKFERSDYEELNNEEKSMIDAIFDKAYIEFFEEIDAIDNGVEIASGDNMIYNYHINSGISSRVSRLNPFEAGATPEQRLDQFKVAMQLVGGEISEGIEFLGKVWWPKRLVLRDSVIKRKEFDPSGQIVLVDSDNLTGWKSSLMELEEELGIVGQIRFIIYNDDAASPRWRAIAVPVSLKSFTCRTPLAEAWRGQRDEELQRISGVPDANFVHMNGFTGGANSLAGIKLMVRKSLGLE